MSFFNRYRISRVLTIVVMVVFGVSGCSNNTVPPATSAAPVPTTGTAGSDALLPAALVVQVDPRGSKREQMACGFFISTASASGLESTATNNHSDRSIRAAVKPGGDASAAQQLVGERHSGVCPIAEHQRRDAERHGPSMPGYIHHLEENVS